MPNGGGLAAIVGAGAILKLGLPANVSLQAYWNALAPSDTPTWLVKLTVAFMFPIAKDAAAAGRLRRQRS